MAKIKAIGDQIWPVVIFGATLVVLVCLIAKLLLAPEVSPTLVIAIAVVSVLLILSPRVFELVELKISKEGMAAKLHDVEEKVEVAKQKVEVTEQKVEVAERKIEQLFAYTMSDSMFTTLRRLSSGHFGHFRNQGGLRRELRHLRAIGYITVQGHIGDLPSEGQNLSDFVSVTLVGKEFVSFRISLDEEAERRATDGGGRA